MMRNLFVYLISTIACVFLVMCVVQVVETPVENNTALGVIGIVSALNGLAVFKSYAWLLFWDSIIPKIHPEKISELEKENPET